MKEMEQLKVAIENVTELVKSIRKDIERLESTPDKSIPVPENIVFSQYHGNQLGLWNSVRRLMYHEEYGGWDCVIFKTQPKRISTKLIPVAFDDLEPGDWFVFDPKCYGYNRVTNYNLYLGDGKSVRFSASGAQPLNYDEWKGSSDFYHKVVPA